MGGLREFIGQIWCPETSAFCCSHDLWTCNSKKGLSVTFCWGIMGVFQFLLVRVWNVKPFSWNFLLWIAAMWLKPLQLHWYIISYYAELTHSSQNSLWEWFLSSFLLKPWPSTALLSASSCPPGQDSPGPNEKVSPWQIWKRDRRSVGRCLSVLEGHRCIAHFLQNK